MSGGVDIFFSVFFMNSLNLTHSAVFVSLFIFCTSEGYLLRNILGVQTAGHLFHLTGFLFF